MAAHTRQSFEETQHVEYNTRMSQNEIALYSIVVDSTADYKILLAHTPTHISKTPYGNMIKI